MNNYDIARQVIALAPQVKIYLNNKTRFLLYEPAEYKTVEYMQKQIEGLIASLYNNRIGGEFIDVISNVISGQLTQAYQRAFEDNGFTDYTLPDYLQSSLTEMIANQYTFVDQLFRDVIDARIDGTPLAPLLSRASLWSNRWTEAYNEALRLMAIKMGGKLMWVEGDTDHKCTTCLALDGIVAFASEWDTLGIKPQSAPNNKLECEGWKCQCALVPTDKRRSPNAYGRLEQIMLER